MQVKKKSFGSEPNAKLACVNPAGDIILGGIEQLRSELAEAQKEFDKKFEAFKLTMQPLEAITIAIRRRFLSNYRKQAGTTPGHRAAIKGGNIAAHHGDVITDTPLVAGKDIEDTDIYRSLYWISPEQAEPYFNFKIMVKMINKQATMRADFRRGSKPWDVGRQDAFQKVLSFWDNAGSDERRQFEDIDGDGLPEERKWLSIACA
ncbi:hypothetical protein L873DRAFT_1822078 [Choiromyces venosus 120613-1]|uniref:Uncharacterized protein n=1 Tax=Choiromyces venosus 120613-1 TaxID=1336337 RepID=A0A3N4J7M4_9PEZI|nr:hypothetical protein L873DRAFT_1822078 [Choiromyces venosus 120613-1]